MIDRVGIRKELVKRFAAIPGVQNVHTRRIYSTDIPEEEQPALLILEGKEVWHKRPTGMPQVVTIEADIWIYRRVHEDEPDPTVPLDELMGAVEKVLEPDMTGSQTLGIPQVIHCWIEGDLLKDYGDEDGQARACIPINIKVAG